MLYVRNSGYETRESGNAGPRDQAGASRLHVRWGGPDSCARTPALWAPVQTLDTALEDEVVVVDTNDSIKEAIWGELLSTYAAAIGARGMVTNGAVRDVAGIRDIGFPVFARTVTPRGPSGREETDRNVQVTVGGVSIDSGDVLIGDESGVVAIDRDAVKDVTSAAERVAQTEHEVDRFIDEGRSLERAFEDAGMG
ncbi:RraA family protein [Halalkalicoccus salilacus]|uniref:RraA family protein n=1 Tax=Halalkalicoccus sp. GCM10025704 TaxID=3252662 RepID=UPI0036179F5A